MLELAVTRSELGSTDKEAPTATKNAAIAEVTFGRPFDFGRLCYSRPEQAFCTLKHIPT